MFRVLYELRIGDFFTFLNLFFGFAGIIYLLEDINMAIIFLFVSALMDGADGFIASKFGGGSLGHVLDSLADVVSFGVLPAAFIALLFPDFLVVSLIYLLSGAIRLARFSVQKTDNFMGYPITASALMIGSMIYLNFNSWTIIGTTLILSAFMITELEYVKMKDKLILFVVAVIIISSFYVKDAAYATISLTALYLFSPFPWRFYQWLEFRRRRKLYSKRA